MKTEKATAPILLGKHIMSTSLPREGLVRIRKLAQLAADLRRGEHFEITRLAGIGAGAAPGAGTAPHAVMAVRDGNRDEFPYTARVVSPGVSYLIGGYMETRLPPSESDAVRRCFQKDAEEQFIALAETLLWRNQSVAGLLDDVNGPADGLNPNQCAFATVAMLDKQVPGGGLWQFFWNCPGWGDEVPTSLRSVGLPVLADAFERSTSDLIAQIGTCSEFRKNNSLDLYSECAGDFNFEEFDSAYFDHEEQVHEKSIGCDRHSQPDIV